jgi:hypothetical protein
MKKALFLTVLLIVTIPFYIKSCTSYKLDEETFYKDEYMELKVIRYQENIFLHYNGPTTRVACKSKNTKPQAWHKVKDKNWTQIYSTFPAFSNLGVEPSLSTLTEAARSGYHVTDANTLIYTTGGASITVSWDGCVSFKSWHPKKLSDELIDQKQYLQCMEESKIKEDSGSLAQGWGKKNCKSENFYRDNTPTYSAIKATHNGDVSFIVTSRAFKDWDSYHITTKNYGKTWGVKGIKNEKNRDDNKISY